MAAWFQLAVMMISIVVPIVALADAMRFDGTDYRATDLRRSTWLVLIATPQVLLLLLGGWRPGTPFGMVSLLWLVTMAMALIHLFDVRPRLARSRNHRSAAAPEIFR